MRQFIRLNFLPEMLEKKPKRSFVKVTQKVSLSSNRETE